MPKRISRCTRTIEEVKASLRAKRIVKIINNLNIIDIEDIPTDAKPTPRALPKIISVIIRHKL